MSTLVFGGCLGQAYHLYSIIYVRQRLVFFNTYRAASTSLCESAAVHADTPRTYHFSSSSREPLDLAIFDEELGEVLIISGHFVLNGNAHPVDILDWLLCVLLEVLPDRLSVGSIHVTLLSATASRCWREPNLFGNGESHAVV